MAAHRAILLLATVVLFLGCGNDPNVVKRAGQPDYIRNTDVKLMERAMQKARATQREFTDAFAAMKPGTFGFCIKKGFPVATDATGEFIWLNNVKWDGKVFEGQVNNEPVDTKAVKMGDRVKVSPEELADWMYIEGRDLKGGYTTRVLHYQSSPEEQKETLKHVPFSIPPIDF